MKKSGNEKLDALIKKGKTALRKKEFAKAVKYLKQARQIAPLRSDVKRMLVRALDGQAWGDVEPEPVQNDEDVPSFPEKQVEPSSNISKKETISSVHEKISQPRRGFGWKIGCLLFLFCAVCLLAVIFFFVFSDSIQKFIQQIGEEEKKVQITEADREAAELYKKAELLQDQRRYSEAIEVMEEAIELNPTNVKQFEDKLAQLYYLQAEVYYKKDEYLKAIAGYKKAVELNPESDEYYYGLGWAYYIQGRKNQNRRQRYQSYYTNAHEAFMKVLSRDSDNIRVKQALARVYIARNETAKAAEMYRQIIRDAPESRESERARRSLKSMGLRE